MEAMSIRQLRVDIKTYFKFFLIDLDKLVSEFYAVSENLIPFEKKRIERDALELFKKIDHFIEKWTENYLKMIGQYYELSSVDIKEERLLFINRIRTRLTRYAGSIATIATRLLIEADSTSISLDPAIKMRLKILSKIDGLWFEEIWSSSDEDE